MAPELGLWWPMSPWLSPGAAWFIFFNVLVGAIALMSSRGRGQGQDDGRRRPVRTASTVVLESLRSVSIFSFHPTTADHGVPIPYSAPASQLHHVQDQYYAFQEQEAPEVNNRMELQPASVDQEETVAAAATTATSSAQSAPVAAAAALDAPATASKAEAEDGDSISLDEAYALARATRQPAAETVAATAAATTATSSAQSAPVAAPAALDASATASKGEAEDGDSISLDEAYALARATRQPAAETVAATAAAAKKVKGRGGACGRGRGAEEVEGKAQVDARAEQFIRQFREGLKLERINSILNYTHALRRSAGAR